MRALGHDHPVHFAAQVLAVLIHDPNESGDLAAISVSGIAMLVDTFAVVLAMARPRLRGCALTG